MTYRCIVLMVAGLLLSLSGCGERESPLGEAAARTALPAFDITTSPVIAVSDWIEAESTLVVDEHLWRLESTALFQQRRVDDLLLRRTRLGLILPLGGEQLFPELASLFQQLGHWSESRWESEVARYRDIWQRYYSLPMGDLADGNG